MYMERYVDSVCNHVAPMTCFCNRFGMRQMLWQFKQQMKKVRNTQLKIIVYNYFIMIGAFMIHPFDHPTIWYVLLFV